MSNYAHTTGLGIPISGEVEGKKERKIKLNWGKFFFLCNLRWRNFYIPGKLEVVTEFDFFVYGAPQHVIVNGGLLA